MIFEIYPARRGLLLRKQWRWRLKAGNGRIIAVSGEGFNNRADAQHSIDLIRNEAASAPIEGLEVNQGARLARIRTEHAP